LTPYHFGVFFGLKIQFEKLQILIMDVGEGKDPHFPIRDFLSKSQILDLDEKEVENVNKGGWRINKHVELWVRNVFDEWRIFHGFDTTRSIIDLSKNESYVKDLVDIISFFVLQVAKKIVAYIFQLGNFYPLMFQMKLLFYFCNFVLGFKVLRNFPNLKSMYIIFCSFFSF